MDPKDSTPNTEAELESFRRQWREEVTARRGGKAPVSSAKPTTTASSSKSHGVKAHVPDAATSSHARQRSLENVDEVTPYAYHDLGEKKHGRRLDETSAETAAILAASKEPSTALEHYEKAVEKENQGSLGDSLHYYRRAFRLDDNVHETYKAKHFPPSYFKAQRKLSSSSHAPAPASGSSQAPTSKPQDPKPSTSATTIPETAHHSLQGLSAPLQALIGEFSTLSIQGEAPPTDLSPPPPCPISTTPEEILVEILEQVAINDLASFVRLAQVCKRLAYLVATEDRIWKRIALGNEYGFAGMHYSWTCQIDGQPLGDDDEGGFLLGTDSDSEEVAVDPTPSPLSLTTLLVPNPYPTYRTLFQKRPRIRFNGCYICTVNYTRTGQASPTSITWNSPIHIVTYFRYLRFLRDGTCISLLSTAEPPDVVPYLTVANLHKNHGALPSAPMKDAVLGRWHLSGPEAPPLPSSSTTTSPATEANTEGILTIESPGATPKYLNRMMLKMGNAGRGAKNNKLVWQGYWDYNRLTDDWGSFGMNHDRPFYWSRVRSYGMGWEERGIKE